MNNFVHKLKASLSIILSGLFFLISIGVIVFIFPREAKFSYEFQKNTPWMHEVLIAPFDFPIYKTETELKYERDSILNEFKPYFNYDLEEEKIILSRFEEHVKKKWEDFDTYVKSKDLKLKYRKKNIPEIIEKTTQKGKEFLQFTYSRGIIDFPDILEQFNHKDFALVIVKNKMVEETDPKMVFTQKTAYEYIKRKVESMDYEAKDKQTTILKEYLRYLDLNEYITPNLFYDLNTSERVKKELIESISINYGKVQKGERIISKGELVNYQRLKILESLKREYESKLLDSTNYNLILLGQILLISIIHLVLILFLSNFRKGILQSPKETLFMLMMILMLVLMTAVILKFNFSIYIVPFALIPIIVKTFYDARLALFIHMITLITVGFLAPNAFEFVFLNFIAGIAAIISLTNFYRRVKLFITALIIFLAYSLVYFGLAIIQEGSIENIDYLTFGHFALNAVFVLTSFLLIYLFEWIFGFLSDATLMELADTNRSLLRNLAEKAPGTFQHSMQVANLAEEATFKIGGNPLLARVGALYHDIGKINNPEYFIENQSPGMNPHDKIDYDESAQIIIDHVLDGIELAKKNKIPSQIIDFIRTHHGDGKVMYFYKMFQKKYPKVEIEDSLFTYPGPKPYSKETAVVMMADSIEAASRSLKQYTPDTIRSLIDSIINGQLTAEQYNNADISYKDITVIKELFVKKLLNIYHARIEYPK